MNNEDILEKDINTKEKFDKAVENWEGNVLELLAQMDKRPEGVDQEDWYKYKRASRREQCYVCKKEFFLGDLDKIRNKLLICFTCGFDRFDKPDNHQPQERHKQEVVKQTTKERVNDILDDIGKLQFKYNNQELEDSDKQYAQRIISKLQKLQTRDKQYLNKRANTTYKEILNLILNIIDDV